MTSNRTVSEIVASLESQLAFYREKEELHAKHEAFHREQRTLYGAEREKIERNLEAFGTAATSALDLAEKTLARPPARKTPIWARPRTRGSARWSS